MLMVLDQDSRKWLSSLLGDNVRFDEPMSRHTSLRVGGPAEVYATPEKPEALAEVIKEARQRGIAYLVIGDGTNLLVKDGGLTGIVIVLKKCLKDVFQKGSGNDGVRVIAMAGAKMHSFCQVAIRQGLEGMNFAMGIPGTVGGGIKMNAGTAYGSVAGVLESVKVLLPGGQTKRIPREHLNFAYRKLILVNGEKEIDPAPPVILDGCFCLQPADPRRLQKEAREILSTRKKTQPINYASAGCFFKNPPGGKTAGELIELAGLKKEKIGGAEISSKHANFFINTGKASAADIIALKELVQETVERIFNITLEPEVQIVGS